MKPRKPFAPISQVDEAHYDEQFNINVKGAYFTIQQLLPLINDGGSIILNTSINAHMGMAGSSVYSATKGALVTMARTLSAELLDRRIRVNAISPGPVTTPILGKAVPQEQLSQVRDGIAAKVPLGRFGNPEEIAKVAVFFGSDDSSFVLGAELIADGTSMDELVRATGLSRSSIYDTFGDKHGLFVRSIQLYGQEEREPLSTFLQKDFSPKKKIHLLFKRLIADILEDKDNKGCFIVNVITELSCLDKKVAAMASEEMTKSEEALFQWIRQGQAAGEIDKSYSARTLARHLQNTINGLRVTGKARAEKAILEDIVKAALAILD